MKEIIKLTYRSNENAKKSVDEGAFTLRQAERDSVILSEHWNLTARPWQCVLIRLDSQKVLEYDGLHPRPVIASPQPTTDNAQTTRFRIDFYRKSQFSGDEGTFLYSKIRDTPAVFQSSNSNSASDHVLEEIHHITLGTSGFDTRFDEISDSSFILGPDDKIKPKRLHVRSLLLLNALRSVVKYSSNDTEPLVDGMFPFPFKELYHHREELLEFQKGSSGARANHTPENNADCDRHIDILLEYLDHEPTVQFQSVKKQWAQKVPTTTFAEFWLLLKPGADVYIKEYGQLNACVVDLVHGGMEYESHTIHAEAYQVHVWYLVFNGTVIKRKSKVIQVPVFDGERDIVSLPVFPTSFHDQLDGGILRRTLIERGEKVFRYARGPTFLEYSGSGLKQGMKKVCKTTPCLHSGSDRKTSIIVPELLSNISRFRGHCRTSRGPALGL